MSEISENELIIAAALSEVDERIRSRKLASAARLCMDTDYPSGYEKCLEELGKLNIEMSFNAAWRRMYDEKDGVQLLVLYEKHESRCFDISEPDAMAEACLGVLAQRLNEGWIPADEARPIHTERPIARAYFDTLFSGSLPSPESPLKGIRNSREYHEMSGNVSERDAHSRLDTEIARVPMNVTAVAMLCMKISEFDVQKIRETLKPIAEEYPLLQAVLNGVPEAQAEVGNAILTAASDGSPGAVRRAGRAAYNFLMQRSGYEYERVETVYTVKPNTEWKDKFSVNVSHSPG